MVCKNYRYEQIKSRVMSKFKFTINGKNYEVTVTDKDTNLADVNVNGTSYSVQYEPQTPVASAPVRKVAAPAAATADETTGEGTDEGTTQSYQATVQPVAFDWGTPTGTVAFTDDWNKEVTLPEGVDATAATDNKAMLLTVEPQTFTTWLMLPQSIDGKKVSITYIINKRQFTSIFALDKDNLKVWDDNQHIKYTVTLAPNVISFNPSVQDWANPTDREYQN